MAESARFGELEIAFDDSVLRPRPWTLAQSEWAAKLSVDAPAGPALELCCGAGHIGLAFARLVPRDVVLVDASEPACDFARANASAAGLAGRIDVRLGDMGSVLAPDERFAFALADPPYLPSADTSLFPDDPLTAVDGGGDGLALARLCLQVLEDHLVDDGGAVLQLRDEGQAAAVDEHLRERDSALRVESVRDVDGHGALVHLLARTGDR